MSTGYDILIVEDDDAIATGLSLNLKLAGHTPTIARDGDTALAAVAAHDFELILLDINLPKRNGLEVLGSLRESDNLVPVIVVSAREGEFDKVAALLLARIDAVLRRAHAAIATEPFAAAPGDRLGFNDVVIDTSQRTVTRAGEPVKLTHLEFELLAFLVRHPAQVFARLQLLRLVWGQTAGTPRTVDNFVGQLRKRLEPDPDHPRYFITVRGSGYRFDP
jgi:two-component system alkaline phosphatase synthesis response regulator PhoP